MRYLPHKPTYIALAISVLYSSSLYASFVRSDIDYQYFRDLGENKGQFYVGATNVPIFNKSGAFIGNMLNGVPMPDLKSASRNDARGTLVAKQFITTVKHNTYLDGVEFGEAGNNPDAHHFYYGHASKHPDTNPFLDGDYQVMRLKKLVTEVAPMEMSNAGQNFYPYGDKNRFSHFLRVGSGIQWTRNSNGSNNYVAYGYEFLTGGVPLKLLPLETSLLEAEGSVFANHYGPMASYASPGDSGSPLLGFDRHLNRWVIVGLARTYEGDNGSTNTYVLSRPGLLQQKEREYIVNAPIVNKNEVIRWRNTSGGTVLQAPRATTQLPHGENLDNKDLHFSGPSGVLQLEESINQGAGGLFFNNSFTVRSANNNNTWLGSGVVVGADHTVNWQVKNPAGDRLSKLGTGTLLINGEGINQGDISVGEGRVVLAQRPDASGQSQAFNQIGLTSGRGTVVLNADNQFNPNNFYFGFRGGRLDLNGHSLTFNRIQNTDDGARIVNHNRSTTSHLIIDGARIKWLPWKQQAQDNLTLYEYINPYRGDRTDYFRLLNNPNTYFPIDGHSNEHWEYLGSDKQQAINTVLSRYPAYVAFNGYLGETDSSKHNGGLNVTYRAANEKLFMISGGVKLNGSMNVENGKMLLSGRPTPHAHDHVSKQDVVKDNDWINREFSANYWNVKNDATLYVGRNVSRLTGTFSAYQNATLSLGYINGKTPTCIRSDYSGVVSCNFQAKAASSLTSLPKTQISGVIYLNDRSHLELGKAHYNGKIFANQNTQTTLHRESEWTLPGSSRVYNLSMEDGAVVNLHPWYYSISQAQIQQGISNFNNLYINGNLTGAGQFNFLTNAHRGIGDLITIAGSTEGNFKLAVKNTGAEPNSDSPLRLIRLTNSDPSTNRASFTLKNHFVDLGAYRYVLRKDSHEYRLYSPLKDVELKPNQAAPAVDPARIQQLEHDIAQKNQNANQFNQQLNTQKQQLTNLTRELTAQEQAKSKAQSTYNFYKRQLRGRLPSFRIKYLRNRVATASQQMNEAQSNIDRLNAQVNNVNQTINTLNQEIASINQQVNELQSSLNELNPTPNNQSAEAIRREAEKRCSQNGVSADACEVAIDNTKAANTQSRSADDEEQDAALPEVQAEEIVVSTRTANTGEGRMSNISLSSAPMDANSLAVLGNLQQANLISQYANSALSDLSAQGQNLILIRQGLQPQLTALDNTDLSVWTSYKYFDGESQSHLYRRYEQETRLTQLGVEMKATEGLRFGLALSQSRSNNDFDDNVQGKSRLNMVTGYAKWQLPENWVISLDSSYAQAKNRIRQSGEDSEFKRHIFQTGLNIAKTWQWQGVDIQPSAGLHYTRLGGTSYNIDLAQVEQKRIHLMSYQLGLKLAKTFEWANVKVTPSFETQYIDFSNKDMKVSVNNHELAQKFGRRVQYQFGLEGQYQQWSLAAHIGMFKGNESSKQKYAGLMLKYQF